MSTHVGILPLDIINSLLAQVHDAADIPNTIGLRFLRLPHPRTGMPSLFLPYERNSRAVLPSSMQTSSILEIQMVMPPNPRSWFVEEQIISDGKLVVMTDINPAFLIIPILKVSEPENGTLGQFRQADDIFQEAATKLSGPLLSSSVSVDPSTAISEGDVLCLSSLDCVLRALKCLCEVKEITPEITVYRFSSEKLLSFLRRRVAQLSKIEVLEMSRSLIRSLAKEGLMEDGREDLLQLGCTRAACDLLGQYLPLDVYHDLLSSYDFTKLDAYLKALQDEAMSASLADDDIKSKLKAGKNAKSEENAAKKRKNQAKNSQGVEKLKKVNTNGMAKISQFFQKTS